jgi:hypothetical protein
MSTGTERSATLKEDIMMNLINTVYTANLSVILAEDVGTPELRNPKLSGMSKTHKSLFSRLFKGMAVRK